ncbi:hypothetical protein vseg_017824 [Gypsophila vaccaria]
MKMAITCISALTLLILCYCPCTAQTKGHATEPTLTAAPEPAPQPANISHLLELAGPYHTFLNYLESTKVIDTFQNQANNSVEGLTLFVPKDNSFTSLKNPSLSNLTDDQLKQLCLFHALPHYYSLSDFKNLSNVGPVKTLAGGDYTLNFTDVSGTVEMTSGWTVTKISSSVWSTAPVAVYQVDKVLLPQAIFGTNIPSVPASPPAPEPTPPAADGPNDDASDGDKKPSLGKDSSGSYRVVASLVLALSGVFLSL